MNYKKTKLSTISNIIFFLSVTFCLVFLWCNYSTKNLKTSLLSSIIIVISVAIIIIPIIIRKHKKSRSKEELSSSLQNFKLRLQYSQEEKVVSFLKEIFGIQKFKKISSDHYIADDNKDMYIVLTDSISADKAREMIACRKTNIIDIICISKTSIAISQTNLQINFFDLEYLSKFDEVSRLYLDKVESQKKAKYSLKDIVCIVLNKKKSKSYFWLGIVLLFSSLFTPFSTYYIIFSTIFLLLSLICRFASLFRLSD